ncbi:hypothetical protein KUTeg_004608 [Tegillarca granosa]|uniref:Anticodon-binding domain-containing protein n=1 Tax=Tegillarca granosa TaxID=220873 RepID=A0ABQ9FS49_TEGGR|nr:hypothetical protein KUTeg_004608 [Tegillarca granosa]
MRIRKPGHQQWSASIYRFYQESKDIFNQWKIYGRHDLKLDGWHQRNLLRLWNWMVTTRRNTYPVESSLITSVETDPESLGLSSIRKGLSKDCYNHFPQICRVVNYKLPFTIVQTALLQQPILYHSTTVLQVTTPSHLITILCLYFSSITTTNLVSQHYCSPSDNTKSFDNLIRYRLQWWRQCKNRNKSVIPHIIESNLVLERGITAYLFDAFTEKQKISFKKKEADTTSGDNRQVLQFSTALAPYKVAIAISGSRTREVKEIANHLLEELKKTGLDTLDFDDVCSLESQIVRNDEMGIPFTVIVNDNTLETGIVSCRNRDTTLKEQNHITKLKETLLLQLNKIHV